MLRFGFVWKLRMSEVYFTRAVITQSARIDLACQALAGPGGAQRADAVHDLRLALRVLRTVLLFFRGSETADTLRRHLARSYRLSREARELEVALDGLALLQVRHPLALNVDLAWARALQCERSSLLPRLQPDLVSALALLLSFLAGADALLDKRRLRKLARMQAKHLWQKVQDKLLRAFKSGKRTHWHAARLAIKRYRGWGVQFAPLLKQRTRKRVKILLFVQGLLGELNDWGALAQRLQAEGALAKAWRRIIVRRERRLQKVLSRYIRRQVWGVMQAK